MSVKTTSSPIPSSVSLSLGSFSVNNSGGEIASGNEKTSFKSQVANLPVNKLPVAAAVMAASTPAQPTLLSDNNSAPIKLTTGNTTSSAVTVSVAPKAIIHTPAVITIAASTRATAAHSAKTYDRHHLPVKPLTSSSLSLVMSRATGTSVTTTTGLIEPGSNFISKPTVVQPPLLPAKVSQVFIPSGLIPPVSSIKLHQPFSPTFPYQISSPQQTSNKQPVTVSTHRVQPPVLFHPVYTPQSNRAPISLTVSNSQDSVKRADSQLNSAINISIPAKPSSHQDSGRVITSSQVMKPLHQIVSTHSHSTVPVTPVSTSAMQRLVAVSQSAITASTNWSKALMTSSTSTVATPITSFTYSAATTHNVSKAPISTSSVPVTKVYSPQPLARIHTLQPSVSGISAHVRTSEFLQPITAVRQPLSIAVTTAQTAVAGTTVVSSLASARTSTQSVNQSIVYWQPSYPGQAAASYGRGVSSVIPVPSINVPAIPANQLRLNQSNNLLVMEAARVAVPNNTHASSVSFTQENQVLHTSLAGSDQMRLIQQPHIPTSLPHHVPNMSPKPTILRKTARFDPSISKKLNFNPDSHTLGRMSPLKTAEQRGLSGSVDGVSGGTTSNTRYTARELQYQSNIKPALPGQVAYLKPVVSSNGLPPTSKFLSNFSGKGYSSGSHVQSHGVEKDKSNVQVGRHVQQIVSDVKVKTEPGFQTTLNVKAEAASSHFPSFQPPFQTIPNKLEGDNQQKSGPRSIIYSSSSVSKVRHLQQRGGMLTVATPSHKLTPLHVVGKPQGNAGMTRHALSDASLSYRTLDVQKNIKLEPNLIIPLGGVKRSYDKSNAVTSESLMKNGTENMKHQGSVPGPIVYSEQETIGLSPRKKPRKQTHIVAEELPDADQVVDDEMSTDDADECEDEKPLVSPANRDRSFDVGKMSDISTNLKPPLSSANSEIKQPVHSTSEVNMVDAASSNNKFPEEYFDKDGVRYIAVRERPPITLIPSGHRMRSVHNHFFHYSDVKVKEKKINLHDQCFDEKYIKGWKIMQFASQLEEVASLDADAHRRIEKVQEGLLQHLRSLFPNYSNSCEVGCRSPARIMTSSGISLPSPSTPQSLNIPSSFAKPHFSCPGANGSTNSPLTPAEKKAGRFQEEILKIDDFAEANKQRCNVIREQLIEAKSILVKVLDNRNIVAKVIEAGREAQKPVRSANSNGVRGSKRKKS